MQMIVKRASLAVLTLTIVVPALTQSAPDAAKVTASYSLTKTGFGSADRVTDPGTIYVFRIDGTLARAVADHTTPTNVIAAGKLVPPAKGFIASFGAGGDSQQIKPGTRFYLHEAEVKDDAVLFTFLSLEKSSVVVQGHSTSSRLRMYLKFALTKPEIAALTPDSLHKLTDPVFLPEGTPALTPTVQLGQSMAEVRQNMGDPIKEIILGPKHILVYKDIKVTLIDDKVTDAE